MNGIFPLAIFGNFGQIWSHWWPLCQHFEVEPSLANVFAGGKAILIVVKGQKLNK